jgi:asparagine synthase (glutamine-hydrolysing)
VSGILGLYNLDGAPVDPGQLSDMASFLQRRGPERTGLWHADRVGLGHTLLATTHEAAYEQLPFVHEASGCAITADVRLDNRSELLERLGLTERRATIGDAELVLASYLRWGEACPEHLLGDFAFAIWDPRRCSLFCARDHLGMRQLVYHFRRGRCFVFATEPRAIMVLPQVPYAINEARIADFLVNELEGIDKTSTFFEEIVRLPPAHTLTVSAAGLLCRRYWALEAGQELRLTSDAEYVEAFLDVFDRAVACRLRTVGAVGSMLSGGVDSGTAAATARLLLAAEGRSPLHTFSAVSPDGDSDAETDAIHTVLTMDGIEPTIVNCAELGWPNPTLEDAMREIDEPFDLNMAVIQALYLSAKNKGLTMLMDGGAGDIVLWEGMYLARLLRTGHWRTALREAAAQNRFWRGGLPLGPELFRGALFAFAPLPLLEPALDRHRTMRINRRIRTDDLIAPDFARTTSVDERLQALARLNDRRLFLDSARERAAAIEHPYLTVGRERYDRVAGAIGIEPRDPYCDIRVAELCVRLPDRQVSAGGWPKAILRRAGAGRLPDAVRWRQDKENPGWAFTEAVWRRIAPAIWHEIETDPGDLGVYVDLGRAQSLIGRARSGDATAVEKAYHLAGLASWLRRHADRPTVQAAH